MILLIWFGIPISNSMHLKPPFKTTIKFSLYAQNQSLGCYGRLTTDYELLAMDQYGQG